ncbi:MAG: hypothetical protein AB9846_04150 [Tenuifilaceae bacterium]
MQREKIFRTGIAVIIFIVLLSPFSYLIFGKIERGKVTEIVFEYPGIALLPSSSYPKVQFQYQNKSYTILGEENQQFLVGDVVEVIFYKGKPEKAKIYSFWGLMVDSVIQLPIGLLIWWALFQSFPELFSNSISKKEYASLLIKGKLRKKESKIYEVPVFAKIIIYFLLAGITVCLLVGLWIVYQEMNSGKISYQIGIGLIVVIILVLATIGNKVFRK